MVDTDIHRHSTNIQKVPTQGRVVVHGADRQSFISGSWCKIAAAAISGYSFVALSLLSLRTLHHTMGNTRLLEKLVDNMFDQTLAVGSLQQIDLENTTLALPRDMRTSSRWKVHPQMRKPWSISGSRPLQPRLRATSDAALESWAKDVGIQMNGVQLKDFADGLRGMVASTALEPMATLIKAPEDAVIEVTNKRGQVTPFPDFVPQSLWATSRYDTRLAFKLLYELRVKGLDSDKYRFLMSLPKSFITPLHWTNETIRETQYKALDGNLQSQQQRLEELYNKWQAAVTEDEKASKVNLAARATYEDFVWAMECVGSRTFNGVFVGSTNQERQQILSVTAALALLWPLFGFGTWEDSLRAGATIGLFILLRDILVSKKGKVRRFVMCPMMDMFNHRSRATASPEFSYFDGTFELLTGRDEAYKPGEQVYITYGRQGNDRLLQYYGFVEADNIHDSYDFCKPFQELFPRISDAIKETAGELPHEPAAQERTAQLARVLQDSAAAGMLVGTVDDTAFQSIRPDNKALPNVRFYGTQGWDNVTVRCMRAMCASSTEWKGLCDSRGQLNSFDVLSNTLSVDTERRCKESLKALASCELATMPTTLQADMEALASMNKERAAAASGPSSKANEAMKTSGRYGDMNFLALAFRVEKKKLLQLASR